MQSKKYYIWLVVVLVTLLPKSLFAQQLQTISTFSTYTMYGIGELQPQGTLATRSMGGAGVAQRNASMINLLNPASYSMALQKGVLFDFGLEGGTYFASQNRSGSTLSSYYTTVNIQDVAIQLPITKGLGFGLSLTPYSSVGYVQSYSSILTNVGHVQVINSGSGDITEVKFGLGWKVASRLSLGFAAQYYWGDIDRYFNSVITSITTTANALSSIGVENISVTRLKGQAGMQFSAIHNSKHTLNVGATYDLGGELNPRLTRVVTSSGNSTDIYAQSDTTRMSMIMPRQLAFGVNYSSSKWTFAADYTYQNWGDENDDIEFTGSGMEVAYNNVGTLKVGLEFTPRRTDMRRYANRVNYRLGARIGGYQYSFGGEEISQMNFTAGVGLPLNFVGITKINMGLEWGTMGTTNSVVVDSQSIGLVKQKQFKFSLGFTMFGDDYWFMRPQID